MITILSWNVNGLRAVLQNGFLPWVEKTRPDILCLQETRVRPEELPEAARAPKGYTSLWFPARKPGYSGVALYTRTEPLSVASMGVAEFDEEGRLQVVEFKGFTILNGYWPNSQDERKRLDYKLRYCRAITRVANKLVRAGHNVVLCGDLNIAHTEIDLARPKENENSAGYYIEERQAMTRFLKNGYVDTFRHFCKEPGHYTWWSYRTRARERNIGWRLDYHCVNEDFLQRVARSWMLSDVMGSDHCPVGLQLR
ncbi:MAG TPA: exodeoxyribonuclease III [Candidatus Hydrogenedentes bacterium]|nr:exodeoxyribonuclease III [Candidatus Hydrogenedentota bacterium]HNT87459.1 exodeoxyribonuclease III [Candidatus Hydrogenedentota bacterium]